jgi:hypothetical protein
VKESSNTWLRENIAKFFLDLAKLVFTSFILGGFLKGEMPQHIVLVIGGALFALFTTLGFSIVPKRRQ